MVFEKLKFKRFVDGYYDVENQYPLYVYSRAKEFFEREYRVKAEIKSREEFKKRREIIRKMFLESIGGLPEEKAPLNFKVKGVLERKDYKVFKVVYESLPKFYVTGLLYEPTRLSDKVPAVLFLCGHAKEAKAYPLYQKVCIEFVKNGFIVLAIDPIGQGERLQYWFPGKGEVIKWGTYEHSYAGLQHTLIGNNIAKRFIWDGIRGIDLLTSLKEVDSERIGVTGASGGGTQTSYLMLVDDRISVAAPCNYITSREEYMWTGQAHDAEQNIYGAIKYGLNYDDFLISFAPKPLIIGASAYDFFCIEGTLKSYQIAKRIYSLYGAEDKVKLVIGEHVHSYSDYLRREVVKWFKKHLMGSEDLEEVDLEVEDETILRVTSSGQVLEDYPDARTVYDLNLREWYKVKPKRPKVEDAGSLLKYVEETREKVVKVLGLNLRQRENPIYPRIIKKLELNGYKGEKVFFFSEPGIVLTGVIVSGKEDYKRPGTILLLEDGTNDIEREKEVIEKLLEKDHLVFVLDVRGVGGVKTRKINPHGLTDIYGTEFKLAYDALMLGTSTFTMRVFDVLRGYDYLKTRKDVDCDEISIYGEGVASLYAFYAMVLEPGIREGVFEKMLFSYEDVVETRIYNRSVVDERILVHGILRYFDIVDLIPLLHGRRVKFINLVEATGRKVSRKKLEGKWFKVFEENYPVIEPPEIV